MSGAKPVSPRRPLWAELIQPVFEVDALCCPKCGGRLRVLSAITDPVVAARILDCLALPSRAPPLAISGHRVGRSDFDEDWVGGISEFDFDHSQPSNESESGARKEVRWFSSLTSIVGLDESRFTNALEVDFHREGLKKTPSLSVREYICAAVIT